MNRRGFSLVELVVVVAVVSILSALTTPALLRAVDRGRQVSCAASLRGLHLAYQTYLDDHEGQFMPYRETRPDGVLWYWGFEPTGSGPEGQRTLDRTQARLAPYFEHGPRVNLCPAFPRRDSRWYKPKFAEASYGYGVNSFLLNHGSGGNLAAVEEPGLTVMWADAMQINTFQAPASPQNPLLEEWSYLDAYSPFKFHFRHRGEANVVMADGSLRPREPAVLDPRCDGQTGLIEPFGQTALLKLKK